MLGANGRVGLRWILGECFTVEERRRLRDFRSWLELGASGGLQTAEEEQAGGEEVFSAFHGYEVAEVKLDLPAGGVVPFLKIGLATSSGFRLADDTVETGAALGKVHVVGPGLLGEDKLGVELGVVGHEEEADIAGGQEREDIGSEVVFGDGVGEVFRLDSAGLVGEGDAAAGHDVGALALVEEAGGAGVDFADVGVEGTARSRRVAPLIVEIVGRQLAFGFVGHGDGRPILEPPDDQGTGALPRFEGQVHRGREHLFQELKAGDILLELAEDEKAAEGVGRGGAGVGHEGAFQGKGGIPLGAAGGLRFVVDVLREEQGLAAAIHVAEMLDADAEGVADGFAELDVMDGAAALDEEGFDFLDDGGPAGGVVVRDEDHAVDLFLEGSLPFRDGGIFDGAGGFHAVTKGGIAGRRGEGDTERGVAAGAEEGGTEGAAVGLVGFEHLIGEELGVGVSDVVIADFAEGAFGGGDGGRAAAIELEEDIPSMVAAVAFEDVALEVFEHLLLIRGGGFPAEWSGEVDRHGGGWFFGLVFGLLKENVWPVKKSGY